jgi:hypothetical protein
MKNYSDLRATSALVQIELTLLNNPRYVVAVDGVAKSGTPISHWVKLDQPFSIEVTLLDKDYHAPTETAVVIDSITVDGINVIPAYTHLATYTNDHNYTSPTSHVGFVGKWLLTFDPNFYCWLHGATEQGWLLTPQ